MRVFCYRDVFFLEIVESKYFLSLVIKSCLVVKPANTHFTNRLFIFTVHALESYCNGLDSNEWDFKTIKERTSCTCRVDLSHAAVPDLYSDCTKFE